MRPRRSEPAVESTRRLLGELEQLGVRLGLEAVRDLLVALGNPHLRLPHVLVAGTNGKGSTAVQLHSILTAAGYRTGLYTSPHLESVRERLRTNGRAVSATELSSGLQRVIAVAEAELGAKPTYFEALTAVAFDVFADTVDIAVLEVGLGGRLDATNVGSPLAALITEIGVDHAELLGTTEDEIAREKAGIMRRARPVLSAVTSPARAELRRLARELGAEWVDVLSECRALPAGERELDLETPGGRYRLRTELEGEHQRRNLVLAVRAAETLAASGWSRVTGEAIVAGIAGCRWPGRLERVPLDDGREVLLDGAHNAQGAAALAAYMAGTKGPWCLLFGALADKDLAGVLSPLAAASERVVVTTPKSPRAAPVEALLPLLADRQVEVGDSAERALDLALAGREQRIVVCGSIYLVGEVRRILTRRWGRPEPAVAIDLTGGSPAG